MKTYRSLTQEEIQQLKERSCTAVDWDEIEVVENFKTDYIYHTRFSGKVRLGVFEDEFTLAGGMRKHSGLYHATLHNVTVGDNCCIENIKNYIANYIIGDYAFIENVDIILVDGRSKFGNGVEVAVLNETGGRAGLPRGLTPTSGARRTPEMLCVDARNLLWIIFSRCKTPAIR